MKYTWTQSYNPDSKYNRLYRAMQLITIHNELIELDKLEPIEDVCEAQSVLKKIMEQ